MKIGAFTKSIIFLIVLFIGLKLIQPPLLTSLIQLYMGLAAIAILIYVSANPVRFEEWLGPLKILIFEEKAKLVRPVVMVLIALGASAYTYQKVVPEIEPPATLRIIHPAPPSEIDFRGKKIILAEANNPFRVEDKAEFETHVQEGKKIYYQNCFYCHGDTLQGDGHFAHGFNPLPANFVDAGTIAQLQESYVFWRIAKGGPGLPKNAHPWNSAMPAWEDMLTEDEIWKVILWLYEGSGRDPRTWEEGH